MSQGLWIAIAVIAVLVLVALVVGSVLYRRRQVSLRGGTDTAIEAPTPVDRSGGYTASSGITFTQGPSATATAPRVPEPVARDTGLMPPAPPVVEETAAPAEPDIDVATPAAPAAAPVTPDLDTIAPTAGRLERLRGRLAKSQSAFGRSMLGLLGGGDLDEDSWEEVEDTLLVADLGPT
ncbi:MAG: signal recognition particle-docking protein FtsY, partial [Mycobacterium sp.]